MENKSNKIVCRELAIKWWNGLISSQKTQLCDTNTDLIGKIRRWETLTESEIEKIWKIEHPNLITSAEPFGIIKPFKKFNPDLFKAYINKFSDEDKCVALVLLIESLNVENDVQLAFKLSIGNKIINGW